MDAAEPATAGVASLDDEPAAELHHVDVLDHETALDRAELLVRQGHLAEGQLALEQRWELLSDAPTVLRGRCRALMALLYDNQGQLSRAMLASYGAIELFREAGDDVSLTRSLTLAAVTAAHVGDGPQAFELIGEAQRLGESIPADDIGTHFRLQNNMGIIHQHLGDLERAVVCADAALEVARRGDDAPMIAHAETMAVWSRIYRALQPRPNSGVSLMRLQPLLHRSQELLDRYETSGYTHLVTEGLRVHGTAHLALGQVQTARGFLERALECAEEGDHRTEVAHVHLGLGRTERAAGDHDASLTHLAAALEMAHRLGEPMVVAQAHEELSTTHEAAGDLGMALEHYRMFHKVTVNMMRTNADTRAQLLSVRLEAERARREADQLRSHADSLAERNEELARDAQHDPLTGLGNRRHLNAALEDLRTRPDLGAVLAIADLDHFKQVNDTYTHAVGDEVLREVATLLRVSCRPGDVVVRFGGEEFVLLLVGASLDTGLAAAERLRCAVQSHDWSELTPGRQLTISIGMALTHEGEDVDSTLKRADEALYRAKADGRNTVRVDL